MVAVRRARWVSIVSAMPSPPLSSAVRPARVRKVASRSVTRVTCGWTSRGLRARQPGIGPGALQAGGEGRRRPSPAAGRACTRSARGRPAAGPARRPGSPGSTSRRGPRPNRPPTRSGSRRRTARIRIVGLADPHRVADADAQAGQERRLGHAAAVGQRLGQRQRRVEHDLADQRVGSVDRLEVDRHRPPVGPRWPACSAGPARSAAAPAGTIRCEVRGRRSARWPARARRRRRAAPARRARAPPARRGSGCRPRR